MNTPKRYLLLAAMLSTLHPIIAATDPLRLSEPVEVTSTFEVFGAPMQDKSPGQSLQALIDNADELNGQTIRLTSTVKQVCQKKGCFFIAAEGAAWARITFLDYSFFVPTDSAGKQVTLEGTFSKRVLSAEEVAHYAADLGNPGTAASHPREEYGIVATSVLLPKG
ncbi:MAG: DUF4920 domain-containing protein [Pseudomonadota bacterium]